LAQPVLARPEPVLERHLARPSTRGRAAPGYLHIVDALETAHAFGLCVRPPAGRDPALSVTIDFDPCQQHDFDALIRAWPPLTYAVHSLNHSVASPIYIRSSWQRRWWASCSLFTAWFTRAVGAGPPH
jgi:hypothetical protein